MTFESWEALLVAGAVTVVGTWWGRGYWDRRARDDRALENPAKLKEWARQTFVSTTECAQCKGHQAAEDGHLVAAVTRVEAALREMSVEVFARLREIEGTLHSLNGQKRRGDPEGFDPGRMRNHGGERRGD